MKHCSLMSILLTIVSFSTSAIAGEIVVSPQVRTKINSAAVGIKRIISIDPRSIEHIRLQFRTWVTPSINLNEAHLRESAVYDRKIFRQERKGDTLRLPTEKIKSMVPQIKLRQPVQILFKEGATHFEFLKIKEVRAKTRLESQTAISLAKNFLMSNGFLKETQKDKIASIEISERRINEDGDEGKQGHDYLVQQDVIFCRAFDGKPVLNSKIAVGFLPDTREIVQVKHLNWTPVEEEKPQVIDSRRLEAAGLASGEAILARLQQKIRDTSGNFVRAEIKNVRPGWFQTQSSLVPVMFSEIYTQYPDGYLSKQLEVINMVGGDEIFWHDRRRPYKSSPPGIQLK